MFSVRTIETSSLGDRSYVVTDGGVAVVVDPQRDVDRVLRLLEQDGLRVSHVLETHVHNDYVTGGPELARITGAVYVLPEGGGATDEHLPAADGDVLAAGDLQVRAWRTPGHTHHHTSYAIEDSSGVVQAVLTGGSMLYGSTGRTDLVGPESTDELTHAQFHSVRRLAAELPAATEVFPTHGFGSFCAATPTSGTSSTVGDQRSVNPALTLAEHEYVETLIAGLGAYPAYYAHMGAINRSGPAAVDLSVPPVVSPAQLRERIERGEWVVDLRSRTAFAAGHLAGARSFELSPSFVTYLGWLHEWGAPLTLIAERAEHVADARRELVRIGVDVLAGAAVGDVAALADGRPVRSYPVSDFAGLAAARAERPVVVLDARRDDERQQGAVRDSLHIPIHELTSRIAEVPDGEVWVYCGSGYRASIATSLLDQDGRHVVLVDDAYVRAAEAGLEATPAVAAR